MAADDPIDTAILLAAGEGQRLRSVAPIKPLCVVGGQPLLDHAITGLAEAGLKRAIIVLGYEAEPIVAHLAARSWPLEIETVSVVDYRRPNGVSVLAARHRLQGANALLAMGDHLVEPDLYRLMAAREAVTGIQLAVDRRLDNPFVDLVDVTRVKTQAGRIVAIGKLLPEFDCFDTGVFAIGELFFQALDRLDSPSVTEGVQALIPLELASTIECERRDWIDVDDDAALQKAERWLARPSALGMPERSHLAAPSTPIEHFSRRWN
ncbi:NTP transferase domain-containing protein [Sphingobium yanoikuyae]|uniref:NTP transferase domain-containing protein n=1 Tax=Sphingobium yanoikuyae TaxID=13690 RepID=A0AA42X0F4_SPHYA|nr:NTP transferase domain-containing protein [Sphingobium yanoikuyae]MDH2135174.1 NTP transferase domain-containing protein [Sphingobium yanoikuyae]MDH2151692.1 NTP transferase domain-containing protein [Sphingobium yanoikuyae]MDH2170490.1 NTP transferase domain-containing protein [Sphingobium yanoikuyae]